MQDEFVAAERVANLADHHDVGVAADDAGVRVLERFRSIAAAVLGRLAGDLGGGERMGERAVGPADRGDPDADGDVEGTVADARHDRSGGGADLLGNDGRLFEVDVRDERREAVP